MSSSVFDHKGEPGPHSVIQDVAEEHGPAVGHTLHQDGNYSVVSHHADGHTHISNGHPTFEHALEHIAHAHLP